MITNQNFRPTFAEFKKLARKGNLVPVYVDVMADQVTPVSLLSARWKSSSHCFLLESVEGGESLGRYSILSFDPEMIIQETRGETLVRSGKGKVLKRTDTPAMDVLRSTMKRFRPVDVPGLPRFFGGAVGYAAYETVHHIERLPKKNPDPLKWPESLFFLTGDLFVFDNT